MSAEDLSFDLERAQLELTGLWQRTDGLDGSAGESMASLVDLAGTLVKAASDTSAGRRSPLSPEERQLLHVMMLRISGCDEVEGDDFLGAVRALVAPGRVAASSHRSDRSCECGQSCGCRVPG
jgi:hypothetical protein